MFQKMPQTPSINQNLYHFSIACLVFNGNLALLHWIIFMLFCKHFHQGKLNIFLKEKGAKDRSRLLMLQRSQRHQLRPKEFQKKRMKSDYICSCLLLPNLNGGCQLTMKTTYNTSVTCLSSSGRGGFCCTALWSILCGVKRTTTL